MNTSMADEDSAEIEISCLGLYFELMGLMSEKNLYSISLKNIDS